jgi:hypothetical protein
MNNEKLLTIGMATYDDYDGVYFTIQALRLYHDICNTDKVEFVVLDNNPDSKSGKETKNFVEQLKQTYIPYTDRQSSFVKYEIAKHAKGKYVIIMDSHVLLTPGAITSLLEYYEKNPDCKNLIQGPMIYNNFKSYSTHWDTIWRGHMYGTWGTNKEAYERGEPFIIPMQGMGMFSFEKAAFKGISSLFRGHGGEQGYIAEKFRSWGGENICLPQFKWAHRFGRPLGTIFRVLLEDRVRNYFIGWLDLYGDPNHTKMKETYEHFKNELPDGVCERIMKQTIKEFGL